MRINWTGKITDKFYVLGHPSVPVYLLDGPVPALFDAGFTALARVYEREIKGVLGHRSPAFLFLTHTHWDHIGSARYLKTVWPQMRIAGSSRARDILTRSKAVQQIRAFNQKAVGTLRTWGVTKVYDGQFEPFSLDLVLNPGQTIELGPAFSVQTISTPGHTWDFFTYWVPEERIMIASEAVNCDDISEFLVDYDAYWSSLQALSQLDVEVLCTGHNLVLTGPDAKDHMVRSLDQAADFVAMVERFLQEEDGDVDRVITCVKAEEWDPKPLPKQPEEAYLMNTKTRVKTIMKRMEKRGQICP